MRTAARMALLAALCLAGGAVRAEGLAVLKLQVQLTGAVIHVADIWANPGPKADTVIGPAPPPGRSIAVEAGQLAYIAQLYDVPWHPVSGVERIAIERAGRPLSREEVSEPIRRSLVEAGAAASVSVELANFSPLLVPPASFPLLSVEGLSYDGPGERFSASLSVSTDGMETQRMRVAGRVVQTVPAVVATRRLQPTDVIAADDLRLTQLPQRRLVGPVLADPALAIGQSPKRSIGAGQPVAGADLGPPQLVAKGATVVMVLDAPGMSLAAQGLALGAGGRDEIIQVMNPVSRAVVAARVTGPGRAVIAPGAVPLVPPANATPRSNEVAN